MNGIFSFYRKQNKGRHETGLLGMGCGTLGGTVAKTEETKVVFWTYKTRNHWLRFQWEISRLDMAELFLERWVMMNYELTGWRGF